MSNQIIVPSLGESVTEATVSKWLKQVGEKVDSDEPLVELETDKVNVEVPSPLAGILTSIKVKEGDTVEVGALLGEVNDSKSSSKKVSKTVSTELKKESYTPPKKTKEKKLKKNEEDILTLEENVKEENSSETLVLDTLAEESTNLKEKEEKYITTKTIEGLFILIAQEEKNIRRNPKARVSELLRKVFK